jgi:hypothetical protein
MKYTFNPGSIERELQSFSIAEIESAVYDSRGFCLVCGSDNGEPVEPDAREYYCEDCMLYSIFGAEQILIEFGGIGGIVT